MIVMKLRRTQMPARNIPTYAYNVLATNEVNHKTINAKLLRAAPDDALFWRGMTERPAGSAVRARDIARTKDACMIPHDLLNRPGCRPGLSSAGSHGRSYSPLRSSVLHQSEFRPVTGALLGAALPRLVAEQAISIAERTDSTKAISTFAEAVAWCGGERAERSQDQAG